MEMMDKNQIYENIVQTFSSFLFFSILSGTIGWSFMIILPIAFKFLALPIGLILGLVAYLLLWKLIFALKLIPKEFKTKTDTKTPKLLQTQKKDGQLDLDKFWEGIDGQNLSLDEIETIKKSVEIIERSNNR